MRTVSHGPGSSSTSSARGFVSSVIAMIVDFYFVIRLAAISSVSKTVFIDERRLRDPSVKVVKTLARDCASLIRIRPNRAASPGGSAHRELRGRRAGSECQGLRPLPA